MGIKITKKTVAITFGGPGLGVLWWVFGQVGIVIPLWALYLIGGAAILAVAVSAILWAQIIWSWLNANGRRVKMGPILFAVAGLLCFAIAVGWYWIDNRNYDTPEPQPAAQINSGGRGGNASVSGNGLAIGGAGGASGPGGRGGDGGAAEVHGDGFALGGEGGEAGQLDRGGRGGRSPFEVMGIPNQQLPDGSWLWDKGRGGNGGSPISPKTDPNSK